FKMHISARPENFIGAAPMCWANEPPPYQGGGRGRSLMRHCITSPDPSLVRRGTFNDVFIGRSPRLPSGRLEGRRPGRLTGQSRLRPVCLKPSLHFWLKRSTCRNPRLKASGYRNQAGSKPAPAHSPEGFVSVAGGFEPPAKKGYAETKHPNSK